MSKEAVESKDGSKEKEKSKWAKLGLESSAMSALEEKLQEVAVSGKMMQHTIVGCDGLGLKSPGIRRYCCSGRNYLWNINPFEIVPMLQGRKNLN